MDAVEAGHGVATVNGRIPGPVGTDGIPDAVQAPSQYNNGTINYNIADSDNDAFLNYTSIDSDSDGCYDVVEAGFADPDGDGLLGNSPVTINSSGMVVGQGGYSPPADGDGNTVYDYTETGNSPAVSAIPTNAVIFDGHPGNLNVTTTNTTQYQWQVSTDGGANFTDISDLGMYSGTDTDTLTINNPDMSMNGYLYRVELFNDAYTCSPSSTSNSITLDIRVQTIITNRKVTYRVN